jgi:cyclic beta-1,2-glucan synthetase
VEIDPCIPRAWPGFEIVLRYHSSRYEIAVQNPDSVSRGVVAVEIDGVQRTEVDGPGPGSRGSPPGPP